VRSATATCRVMLIGEVMRVNHLGPRGGINAFRSCRGPASEALWTAALAWSRNATASILHVRGFLLFHPAHGPHLGIGVAGVEAVPRTARAIGNHRGQKPFVRPAEAGQDTSRAMISMSSWCAETAMCVTRRSAASTETPSGTKISAVSLLTGSR